MARIHARHRGRSGSSPQTREKNPKWAPKSKDVEKEVTIISATHDLKMLDVSDRIVDIRDGVIERIRNRDEIDVQVGEVGGGH